MNGHYHLLSILIDRNKTRPETKDKMLTVPIKTITYRFMRPGFANPTKFSAWQILKSNLINFRSIPYLRTTYDASPRSHARTTDTQWRHKSKKSKNLGRCGRQNMPRPYLKIWKWEWIFGHAVKAISSLGVRSPCVHITMATFGDCCQKSIWDKSQF